MPIFSHTVFQFQISLQNVRKFKGVNTFAWLYALCIYVIKALFTAFFFISAPSHNDSSDTPRLSAFSKCQNLSPSPVAEAIISGPTGWSRQPVNLKWLREPMDRDKRAGEWWEMKSRTKCQRIAFKRIIKKIMKAKRFYNVKRAVHWQSGSCSQIESNMLIKSYPFTFKLRCKWPFSDQTRCSAHATVVRLVSTRRRIPAMFQSLNNLFIDSTSRH